MTEFQKLFHTDATVRMMLDAGFTAEDIVVRLVEERNEYRRKFIEVESYAPKKMRLPDGRMMVCHIPDHLIPETDLTTPAAGVKHAT